MKYQQFFISTLKNHYPDAFVELMAKVKVNYAVIAPDITFARRSDNPLDRRLDFCACFLALIKTLDQRGESYETIKRVSLEVVTNYVTPKNNLGRWLKRLPPKLIGTAFWNALIRVLAKKMEKNRHPQGFIAKVISASDQTYGLGYGVDIVECGVCKLFNKHAFGKYTPILCEVDKLTSGLAGLELIRSGTIATGAPRCDFRYRRLS